MQPHPCDLCAAIDPTGTGGPLARHLRPDQARTVARNDHAVAVPTIGAFVPGYLLIASARHATSLGQLTLNERRAVQTLTEQCAARLTARYRRPVLGFEYGLNAPGSRRIEHGHLHLLPSTAGAALRQFLRWHLPLIEVESLEHLPTGTDRSYIAIYEPGRNVSIYPVANNANPRIRLRQLLAELDPNVPTEGWDWETNPYADFMQATVDDLADSYTDTASDSAVLR